MRPLLLGCERDDGRARSAADPAYADLSLWSGSQLVNAHGTPGSLAFFAVTLHDRSPVIVSAHHVLFGGGARAGSEVWAPGSRWRRIGRVLYGRSGIARRDGANTYVDCAVAAIEWPELAASVLSATQRAHVAARLVTPGDRVTKAGAATGNTEGVVVDVSHRVATLGHRTLDAPGQLLVRSTVRGRAFAAEGDSGAALRNEEGDVVGVLWAATPSGEGIASPIDPVLYVLNITPALVVPNDNNACGTTGDR